MKHLATLFAASLLLIACTHGGYKYTIDGTLPADVQHPVLYLTNYDTGDTIDSATVTDGHFSFAGEADASFMARLLVGAHRIDFIVEEGNMVIDSAGVVTGTVLNDRLNEIAARLDSIEEEDDAIALFHDVYEQNKENGLGLWGLTLYTMYATPTAAQIDSILATAPEAFKASKRMAKLQESAKAKDFTAVGHRFTDFEVQTPELKTERLSHYVGKGKYAIVDFWASWCGPCRREMPNLKALYAKYSDRMNFLGVAVWDEPADTQAAIKELELPWPVIVGRTRLTEPTDLYGIDGIPHIIIFDPDGIIVARGLQGEALATKVDELMKDIK